jgi:hypothetical protein
LPSQRNRIAFAAFVAAIAGAFVYAEQVRLGSPRSDFSFVWFAARALLHRENPYTLFGPGLAFDTSFRLHYPGPTLVAAIPFALLPEAVASIAFAALGAGLLAYGITRDNWHGIWLFPSAAFIVAARSAQWSPIMAATYYLPALGWIMVCKPNLGIAVAAATTSRRSLHLAIIGGLLLTIVSLALLPSWPREWLQVISQSWEYSAPIVRPGGVFILFAALRWRQPEARLLLALGCLPQKASWYEALLPLLAARSKREMQILSFTSSLGYIAQIGLLSDQREIASSDIGILMVAFCYLPAVTVVLRRRNEGELPAWLCDLIRLTRKDPAMAASHPPPEESNSRRR